MTTRRHARPSFQTSATPDLRISCLASEAEPRCFLLLHVDGRSRAVRIQRVWDVAQADAVEPGFGGAEWIRGELPLRGARVPVVDLAVCLGQPSTRLEPSSCVVVADVEAAGRLVRVGFLADEDSRVTSARLPRWAVLPIDELLDTGDLRAASQTGPDGVRGPASQPVSSAGAGICGTLPLPA